MADGVALHIRAVSLKPGCAAIEETIRPGEIVGLAGLDGHGQEAFLKAMAGLEKPASGEIALEDRGRAHTVTSLRSAAASGIAYLPRDRRSTGIFPTQSILDNFAISTVGRDMRFGLISKAERCRRYEAYRDRLSIVAPHPGAPITALSGGNQQKVLLARALALEPRFLLLNDPTRGVDVATRHVLYDVFRRLAADGMALVILSSEIEEILVLCHRVLVFREHEVAARHSGDGMTTQSVIAGMFGRAA